MSRIIEFFVPLESSSQPMEEEIARHLQQPISSILKMKVIRKSLDARKGHPLGYRFRVSYSLAGDLPQSTDAEPERRLWQPSVPVPKIVIVGSGPAGTWAALRLADAGVPSVIVERGKPIQPRRRDLAAIHRGNLNPESNYCFGEGGAGTYSDGKLYTRSKDRISVDQVLFDLIRFGAPAEISVDSRPHVGSNRLPKVLQSIRHHLESVGVQYRFETRLTKLITTEGQIRGVRLHTGEELEAHKVILAVGHSARDVFYIARSAGAVLMRKGTAVGVRIELPQERIDQIQYGRAAGDPRLPAAFFEVSAQAKGRGVYSFCMCPGGFIVPAATEDQGVVVNGMSLSRRNSPFANSAIVAAINPEEFGGDPDDTTAGIDFQRRIEHAAYEAGTGEFKAPAQRLADFLNLSGSQNLPTTTYQPGIVPSRIEKIFPPFVSDALKEGLSNIIRRMPGLSHPDAILIAAETRTSSPVRIVRDPDSLQSVSVAGLYPCGEGAGYAGGIVSAAIDGMRVADAIIREGAK